MVRKKLFHTTRFATTLFDISYEYRPSSNLRCCRRNSSAPNFRCCRRNSSAPPVFLRHRKYTTPSPPTFHRFSCNLAPAWSYRASGGSPEAQHAHTCNFCWSNNFDYALQKLCTTKIPSDPKKKDAPKWTENNFEQNTALTHLLTYHRGEPSSLLLCSSQPPDTKSVTMFQHLWEDGQQAVLQKMTAMFGDRCHLCQYHGLVQITS